MAVRIYPMKTHGREDVTHLFSNLNDCIVHKRKPEVMKIISGKRKETFYLACCEDDNCSKLSHDANEAVQAWNKWNPKPTLSLNAMANEMFKDAKPLDGRMAEILDQTFKRLLSKTPTRL